tara:strand:+ start:342 stop:563 length:222 start_codon:yes stop_codon:yes gene_type:complete
MKDLTKEDLKLIISTYQNWVNCKYKDVQFNVTLSESCINSIYFAIAKNDNPNLIYSEALKQLNKIKQNEKTNN